MSPENQNHACSTPISKNKRENEIYAKQGQWICRLGMYFEHVLHILGPQSLNKLPFLLCHIYG